MRSLTVQGDMRKHLLFSIVTAPMVDAVEWLFGHRLLQQGFGTHISDDRDGHLSSPFH